MTRPAKRTPRILVVDDDPGLLRLLTIRLRSQKYEVEPAESGAKAMSIITRFRPDLVITDLRMAEMDGIALLRELQRRWPSLNVIMLTAHGTIPDAVKATQSGAFAFLTKPVEKEQLLEEVRRALKTSGFADTDDEDWRTEFATRSPLVEDRLAKAHLVAATDSSVLITGEPGTGKELLARAIHRASARREGPFISVDCSALEAGAENGGGDAKLRTAVDDARGGSIFLRNVDDLASPLQTLLIEWLRPSGSRDLRVMATSDRRPDELASDGRFLTDLLEIVSAVHIDLPPLSKRREDIPLLAAQCLEDVSNGGAAQKRTLSPESMEALASAKWPGNVRQLRMVVRQVATLGAGAVITPEQVQEALGQATQLPSFDEARDEFTRTYLVQLLQITQGNVSQAARMARRNRTDFYKLLTKHELKPEEFKE
jgi:two-component system response regulator GlrR